MTARPKEAISVFDMLKIGVGPSSSHTLGPWKAARRWLEELQETLPLEKIRVVQVHLYGSLALTGKGHATDVAVMMGLQDFDPETFDPNAIGPGIQEIEEKNRLFLGSKHHIPFDPAEDIIYRKTEQMPFHSNALKFVGLTDTGTEEAIFYSIGGGFVVKEGESDGQEIVKLPYPCQRPADLLATCKKEKIHIWDMVWANELAWREPEEVRQRLMLIWETMRDCAWRGCHTEGTLPGGLNVTRRAARFYRKLMPEAQENGPEEWIMAIRSRQNTYGFQDVLKWISTFALAVNEENAALGRVVTAPTNGAAGVIPAVLLYFVCLSGKEVNDELIMRFLMVAGEVGTFFKKGATISAAMGGCQAEIGVSSAMAAAALTACVDGTVEQCLQAAEIAMEHHLGLTCDPVGGLVQVPCIERNSMGAVKAITACKIALESDPAMAKVTLDSVIETMWDTAQDMNAKYKETSLGGLAMKIPVNLPEC